MDRWQIMLNHLTERLPGTTLSIVETDDKRILMEREGNSVRMFSEAPGFTHMFGKGRIDPLPDDYVAKIKKHLGYPKEEWEGFNV